jgi:hypothetical protein
MSTMTLVVSGKPLVQWVLLWVAPSVLPWTPSLALVGVTVDDTVSTVHHGFNVDAQFTPSFTVDVHFFCGLLADGIRRA